MNKVIFIICDGLADRPIPQLRDKTPLEAADTPNLDRLAKGGISGLIYPIDIGIRPGSDTSHLCLFGYDPKIYYSGRGPFEVAGIGMELQDGDVAFRANMGTVDKDLVIVDRRAGRVQSTEKYAQILNGTEIDGIKFLTKAGTGHRLGLIMRGIGLSANISDADPHQNGVKVLEVKPLDNSSQAAFTTGVLNKFLKVAYQKLANLPPANYLLVRGAGKLSKFPSFQDKYGLKACCIAGAGLYKGIARVLGMQVLAVEEATGKPDTNINNKIKKVVQEYNNFDFFYVHIKAADSLAEDGNWQAKLKFIEKIDLALAPLFELKEALIIVTADHTTSSEAKIHTADPVPVTIYGGRERTDNVEKFSERACAKGGLGHIKGLDLMPVIIDLLGKSKLYGA